MDDLEQLSVIGRRGPGGRGGISRLHDGNGVDTLAGMADGSSAPHAVQEQSMSRVSNMKHGRTSAKWRRKFEQSKESEALTTNAWDSVSAETYREQAPGWTKTKGDDCRTQLDRSILRGAFEASSAQGPSGHSRATGLSQKVYDPHYMIKRIEKSQKSLKGIGRISKGTYQGP